MCLEMLNSYSNYSKLCCVLKAENRGPVSGVCPWCSAKGQINVLRSYAFNFKESITLCSGPLVSHFTYYHGLSSEFVYLYIY